MGNLKRRFEASRQSSGRATPLEERAEEEFVQCALCKRGYRVISFSHLARTHRWDCAEAVAVYKARFKLKYAWSRGSRVKQSRSLTEYRDRIGRKWSRRTVLRGIRARAASGKAMYLVGVLADAGRSLVSAATAYFGSWGKACRAAHLRQRFRYRIPWTRKRVIEEVLSRYRSGKPVYQRAVLEECRGLVAAGRRWIGAWTSVLGLAGVPKALRREPRGALIWTTDRVVQEIRQRSAKGGSLVGRGVPPTLYQAGRKRFGTWRRALQAAGIVQEL